MFFNPVYGTSCKKVAREFVKSIIANGNEQCECAAKIDDKIVNFFLKLFKGVCAVRTSNPPAQFINLARRLTDFRKRVSQ